MSKGKHAARGRFTREIVIMAIGIVVIGALVYGLLWGFTELMGGDPDDAAETTVASIEVESTTTTVGQNTTTTAGEVTSSTATDAPPETTALRPPSGITVLVLNAVGTDGLASSLTAELEALGYGTLEPDDYEPALDQSLVLFREGFGPEAYELAGQLVIDATVGENQDPADADIVVILGRSYEG